VKEHVTSGLFGDGMVTPKFDAKASHHPGADSTRTSVTPQNNSRFGRWILGPGAGEAVKLSRDEQKHFTPRRKVVEGAKKTKLLFLRVFAPWCLGVRLFIFSQLREVWEAPAKN